MNTFLNVVRYCGVSLFLLFNCSSVLAQVDAENKDVPVRISLRPDKETIMLGEPMFIAFAVTNLSGEKLCLGIGGDYRNRFGRPDSFKVLVTAADGAVMPTSEAIGLGGFIGCAPIESGDTYTVRLFLSHWATITRPGSYQVNVKRHMGFSNYEPSEKRKYSMLADVNAKFTVVPADDNKMGAVINSLGSIMLDNSNPLSGEAATALLSLQDKRVISYFAEAVRKFSEFEVFTSGPEYLICSRAIAALAEYDDDRAIQALQGAMNSAHDDTRQDDKYWFVRLRVAQGLKNVNTKESRVVLHKLLKDDNEEVRKAAGDSLKSIGP
jgi:hypothetical protein